MDFNPRTPCGVRPLRLASPKRTTGISIHAPRVGCDDLGAGTRCTVWHFNPRTPCGVRPPFVNCLDVAEDFNPRTPCGVRQYKQAEADRQQAISIHAPRVGCDFVCPEEKVATNKFQSTHPVWGAT